MLDPKQLAEWQRLADAAEIGPWSASAFFEFGQYAEFIAAACNATPKLLAEVRAQAEEIARVRGALLDYAKHAARLGVAQPGLRHRAARPRGKGGHMSAKENLEANPTAYSGCFVCNSAMEWTGNLPDDESQYVCYECLIDRLTDRLTTERDAARAERDALTRELEAARRVVDAALAWKSAFDAWDTALHEDAKCSAAAPLVRAKQQAGKRLWLETAAYDAACGKART